MSISSLLEKYQHIETTYCFANSNQHNRNLDTIIWVRLQTCVLSTNSQNSFMRRSSTEVQKASFLTSFIKSSEVRWNFAAVNESLRLYSTRSSLFWSNNVVVMILNALWWMWNLLRDAVMSEWNEVRIIKLRRLTNKSRRFTNEFLCRHERYQYLSFAINRSDFFLSLSLCLSEFIVHSSWTFEYSRIMIIWGKKNIVVNLSSLEDLPLSNDLYLETNFNERLIFRSNLVRSRDSTSESLTNERFVALTLTKFCCDMKKSRVCNTLR